MPHAHCLLPWEDTGHMQALGDTHGDLSGHQLSVLVRNHGLLGAPDPEGTQRASAQRHPTEKKCEAHRSSKTF